MLTVMKKNCVGNTMRRKLVKGSVFFFFSLIFRMLGQLCLDLLLYLTDLHNCVYHSTKKEKRKLMSRSTAQSYPLLYFAEKVWSLTPQKRKPLSSLPSQ